MAWITAIGLGGLRAWFCRYELTPDSMSYLDLARLLANGHFSTAVSSYWSPLYAALCGIVLKVFRPSTFWEFPAIHVLNLVIFIISLAAFEYFWTGILSLAARHSECPIPAWAGWTIGYAAFLSSSLDLITLGLVNPDLLVSAVVFVISGIVARIQMGEGGTPQFLSFGAILGLGYYVKAPLFLLAFAFLLVAYVAAGHCRKALARTAVAFCVFAVVTAPLVLTLSKRAGRVTFGDTARLSWAWYIDGVKCFRHWQGGPDSSGVPLHPTRKLLQFPEVYEFGTPLSVTYAPWFDPPYWYAGVQPHLFVKRQVIVAGRNLIALLEAIAHAQAIVVAGLLILLMVSDGGRFRRVCRAWPLLIPAVAAIAMFVMVHIEGRFVAEWLVIVWGAIVSAISLRDSTASYRWIRAVVVATALMTTGIVSLNTLRVAAGIDRAAGRSPGDALLAQDLAHLGIGPGMKVAYIGDGTGAYWAHLGQLTIVAEVPGGSASDSDHPAADFWAATPELQALVIQVLAGTGARALIANPPSVPSRDWQRIGETRYYFYPLR